MKIWSAFDVGYAAFDGKSHFLENPFQDEYMDYARQWVDGHVEAIKQNKIVENSNDNH